MKIFISTRNLLFVWLLIFSGLSLHAALVFDHDATNITQADGTTPATPTDGQWVAIWPTGPNWYDLSSFNNDLVGGPNDPNYHNAGPEILNGNPAVAFRGGNYLQDPNGLGFSGDQAHSIFIVTRLNDSWTDLFLFSNDLNVQNEGYSFYQSAANTVTLEGGFGDNLTFGLGATYRNTPFILELRYAGGGWNGTNMNVFFNGVQQTVTGGSGNLLNFSAEPFKVGNYFGRGTSFDLGAMRVYSTALTEIERNTVGVELQNDWGISGSYTILPVPEPSTYVMILLGGILILVHFGRRRIPVSEE